MYFLLKVDDKSFLIQVLLGERGLLIACEEEFCLVVFHVSNEQF